MKTIYKYQIETADVQTIEMPAGAKILCLQMQQGKPCIWVQCKHDNPLVKHVVTTYGTGHEMRPFSGDYVGTYQLNNGDLVFHVFERIAID